MIGKPISDPVSAVSRMPFSTDGIYSFGTLPPLTESMKTKPDPRSPGVTFTFTSSERGSGFVFDEDEARSALARSEGEGHSRRARIGLRLHRFGQGRQRPEGIYPVGREGHARDGGNRIADRLPDHRFLGRAGRRQVSRRRLLGARLRDL